MDHYGTRMQDVSGGNVASQHVAILMAVCNGERFLDPQIETLARQQVGRLDLWISDDGSRDGTRAIVTRVRDEWKRGSVTLLDGPRAGFAENFRALLVNEDIDADYFAFCDQDDLWDDDKLASAVAWLATQPEDHPALYCSRTQLISADGAPVGISPLFSKPPSFRNALVQSIAGGNTMVMNRAARQRILAASRRTPFVSHDWWCYQIVSGVGGTVHYSPESRIGYRQHENNLVGENNSWRARIFRVKFLAEGLLQEWNDANLAALRSCEDMLTPQARSEMKQFALARQGGILRRLAALHRSGVYRQTAMGQVALYGACAIGKL